VAIQLTHRRFTSAEYRQMIEAGVFDDDERLELIDGEIVPMRPIGDAHAACVRRFNTLLNQRFAGRAIVGVQNPVNVDVACTPQPDLVLLRPRDDFLQVPDPDAGGLFARRRSRR
jgi:Uma2 family endonuclease